MFYSLYSSHVFEKINVTHFRNILIVVLLAIQGESMYDKLYHRTAVNRELGRARKYLIDCIYAKKLFKIFKGFFYLKRGSGIWWATSYMLML